MIKAVLFDMDGLMFDTENLTYQCVNKAIVSYGYEPLSLENYTSCSARPISVFLDMIKEVYDGKIDAKKLVDDTYKIRMEWQKVNGIPMKDGLLELLEYLKSNGIKMAVVSGSESYIVHDALQFHSILDYFDEIICGDQVTKRKPHPEGFLKGCKALNIDVEDVLVLEDSEAGIEAARNGNMKVICIPDLKYPDEEHLQIVYKMCANLKEIIDVVSNLK